MDSFKRLVNKYISDELVELGVEIGARVLIKIIEIKFLNFVEKNRIEFRNTKEERELREYFKNRYINKIKRWLYEYFNWKF